MSSSLSQRQIDVSFANFFRSAILSAAISVLLFPVPVSAGSEHLTQGYHPPNVVVIILDWLRRDAVGAYREKPVLTPNIDQLAKQGVRFENVYTPATLCTPARASIITGTYPHKHGLEKVIYPAGFPGKIPTKHPEGLSNPFHDNRFMLWDNFPVLLHNSGYETAHIGKWHLGPSNPGFFDTWKTYNSLMPHWIGEPYKSTYRENIETDEGIRFIERNADRPFFLYQSFYNPHAPFQPPTKFQDLYKNRFFRVSYG